MSKKQKGKKKRAILKRSSEKIIKKKNLGGRPTKYKGAETIEKIEVIVADMDIKTFFSWCGIENIAAFLNVCRDTIYEWRTKHKEFEAVMKKWETRRNALFYTLSLKLAPGVWIFLAKNWLGLKDKFDFEGAMTSDVYQYISHIPPPKKKEPDKEKEKEKKDYEESED